MTMRGLHAAITIAPMLAHQSTKTALTVSKDSAVQRCCSERRVALDPASAPLPSKAESSPERDRVRRAVNYDAMFILA
jgi:hypothetical protein